ncbi:bestrophin-like domain [Marinobacter arenosus]|uniref:bestrophin-like domain n=1 Tax=Marinobacter arenosus TaxID=2856822 RepID=UPI001C4C7F65|nr:hypothetical protein [Marinobacter arenosus]MBW0149262.1 hypothetical protein [Marinobacter arenosus]
MSYQVWLDSLSIGQIFIVFVLGGAVIGECGYRVGRWWQFRTPGNKEGPTQMLVGSLLGLLAFLLAVTMGMASDRFDTRRGMIVTEANMIGTVYLRAGFLPDAEAAKSRSLLREYAPLRVLSDQPRDVPQRIARSLELHQELWTIAETLAHSMPESVVLSLYIDALNEMIDIHESRVTAGIYGRLPATIFILLLISSVLTLSMVGYSAGLTGRRSPPTAIVMIVVLGAVITLLVDLDRGHGGLITINQQPLIDLQQSMGVDIGSTPRQGD